MPIIVEKTANESLLYDILLQYIFGIGSPRIKAIIEEHGSSKTFIESNKTACLTTKQRERSKAGLEYSRKVLASCAEKGISVIGISDARYPNRLRNIPDPPAVLYYKGSLPDIDALPIICIVGPRRISPFGEKAAYSLSRRISLAGFVTVSGIAVGADSAVHRGALSAERAGIAVLPCGHAHEYLLETRPVRDELLSAGGCILSECPPDCGVKRNSFHIRNRLMSALALGTVVVEAPERSGALITARLANEQGRDVFVVPGNPTLPQYKGSNRLLADGAKPLLDAKTIFSEYELRFKELIDTEKAFCNPQNSSENKTFQKKSCETLSKEAKIVYNSLDKPKFTLDDAADCGLSDDELLAAVTELEIEGLVEQLPGGFYTLK